MDPRPVFTHDARLREQLARLLVTVARGEQVPALSAVDRELYRGLARFGACAIVIWDEAGEVHEFVSPRGPWLKSLLALLQEASAVLPTAVCVDLLLAHDLSPASGDPTIRALEAHAAIEGRVAAFVPGTDALPSMLLTPFHLELLSMAPASERQAALDALTARLHAPGWRLGALARLHCRLTADRQHAYAFNVHEGALRLADDDLGAVLAFARSVLPHTEIEPSCDRALDLLSCDPAEPTGRAQLRAAGDRAVAVLGTLAPFVCPSPERLEEVASATVVAAVTAAKLEAEPDHSTQPLVDHALRGMTLLAETAVTGICEPPAVPKLPPASAHAALRAGVQALDWLRKRSAAPGLVAARQPIVRSAPDPRQFLPPAVRSLEHGNTDSPSGPYRHFRLLQTGVDLAPLLAEIRANESYWTRDTSRQRRVKVQRHTETISLRSAMKEPHGVSEDWHGIALTGSVSAFPVVHRWALDLADRFDSELGRLSIVRLRAGSPVLPHIDNGEYYAYRNRYHLVLASARGSLMVSGSERIKFMPGELWWFDNLALHEAINESNEWRVHLIFDMLPKAVPLPLDVNDALPGVRARTFTR